MGCRMRKNGIVLQKTNKRDAVSFLLFVFLLPYICACLWGHVGEETERLSTKETEGQKERKVAAAVEWGVWELPMEEYLVYRLAFVMPGEYEAEALKAQAVLLRTELALQYRESGQEEISVAGEGLTGFYRERDGINAETLSKDRQAVEETAGMILTYRGDPIRASYFKLSNGSTREAREAGEKACPYLTKISCQHDLAAPNRRSVVAMERNTYIETLQNLLGEDCTADCLWQEGTFSYDSAGYMTNVSYLTQGGERIGTDGETFRHLFGLASASFEMEREEERVLFCVAGAGHGFGMSQYEANGRAVEGARFQEILAGFFPETELTKFE